MKALNKLILISALTVSATALAAALDDESSEGRSANVDQCLDGNCPQKLYSRPATQDVRHVDAVYKSLMNPGSALVDLENGTAVKED